MRSFVLTAAYILVVPLLLAAQDLRPREAAMLLPNERQVSGTVTDTDGKPLSGASIQHLGRVIPYVVTDSSGRFELSTRVPAFVIRKVGYEGVLVRTENAHTIQIMLRRSQGAISVCSSKSICTSLAGGSSVFCFANVKGVKISEQVNDVDYGKLIYSVKSGHTRRYMSHGAGPLWSLGMPSDEDVWNSIEYSEKTYRYGSSVIIDATGKSVSGTLWRSISMIGESTNYSDADQASATLFDQVIDGMCVREEKRK